MKIGFRNIGAFLLLVSLTSTMLAQEIKTVTAKGVYRASVNESVSESRLKCIEKAQLKAIADAFGKNMSQSNMSYFRQDSKGSDSDVFDMGESDVRGEWIETVGDTLWAPPKFENDFIIYSVQLKGRVMELKGNQTQLDWKLLCNGTNPQRDEVREYTYYDGDTLYIYFKSPERGHLAIYMVDYNYNKGMLVQRALPYAWQECGIYDIKADSTYTFYSPNQSNLEYDGKVRKCIMRSQTPNDINQIYVIFSPNNFSKAIDQKVSGNLPAQLGFRNFHKWLATVRRHDPDMCIQKLYFRVKKK